MKKYEDYIFFFFLIFWYNLFHWETESYLAGQLPLLDYTSHYEYSRCNKKVRWYENCNQWIITSKYGFPLITWLFIQVWILTSKYCFPLTTPLFFPLGSSNTRPTHLPTANEVLPKKATVPITFFPVTSTRDPICKDISVKKMNRFLMKNGFTILTHKEQIRTIIISQRVIFNPSLLYRVCKKIWTLIPKQDPNYGRRNNVNLKKKIKWNNPYCDIFLITTWNN